MSASAWLYGVVFLPLYVIFFFNSEPEIPLPKSEEGCGSCSSAAQHLRGLGRGGHPRGGRGTQRGGRGTQRGGFI